jgi:hypothetical protein
MQKDLNGTNVKYLGHEILIIVSKCFLSSSGSSFNSMKAYGLVKFEVLYNSFIEFIIIHYFL